MKWLLPVALICIAITLTPTGTALPQTGSTAPAATNQLPPPVFAPLSPWSFPNRDAVNAGIVTIGQDTTKGKVGGRVGRRVLLGGVVVEVLASATRVCAGHPRL